MHLQERLAELQAGVKQLCSERDGAVKALRRTKHVKEEQAGKLTELSVGFESMVLVRTSLMICTPNNQVLKHSACNSRCLWSLLDTPALRIPCECA